MTDASTPTVRYWRHKATGQITTQPAQPITRFLLDDWQEVRVLSDAELAASKAEVAEKARADERERIALAIEARATDYRDGRNRHDMPVHELLIDDALKSAARTARTPDQIGDTP